MTNPILQAALANHRKVFERYFVYTIANSFLLFTTEPLRIGTNFDIAGPYEITTRHFELSVIPNLPADMDDKLLTVAEYFCTDNKLQFTPGHCSIATTDDYAFPNTLLFALTYQNSDIPTDVTLRLENATLEYNQAVLRYYGLGFLLKSMDNHGVCALMTTPDEKLTFDELKATIEHLCARRGSLDYPLCDTNILKHCTLKTKLVCGTDGGESEGTLGTDFAFLVGPDEERIEVNRAVLAHSNPVLAKMLYGTELLKVNPDIPIQWTEFDPMAVRLVFAALMQKPNSGALRIPHGVERQFYLLLDFLNESRAGVNVRLTKYDKVVNRASMNCDNDDVDGGKLDWMVGKPPEQE